MALAALGLSILDRYSAPPAEVRRSAAAPAPAEPLAASRPNRRRRLAFVAAPVALASVAAVLAAGLAQSSFGTISTVAGTGVSGDTGDGGQATAARFKAPEGAALGPDGDLYIADTSSHRVRRVDSDTGVISTVAGLGYQGNTGDGGAATSAALNEPVGIAVDAAGNVYIADSGNNKVRRVSAAGIMSTFAGTGAAGNTGNGGSATSATLRAPMGVAVVSDGSVLIADTNNHVIRRVDASGIISTVAGTSQGYLGDNGAATSARLRNPYSVTPAAGGGFYISDTGNHAIRRVSAGGTITTIAGTGTQGFSGDDGPAAAAHLSSPVGVVAGAGGVLYIADTANHRVRRIDPATGVITTVAGTGAAASTGDGGSASAAALNYPMGITASAAGLYIPEFGGLRVRFVEGFGSGPAAPAVSAVAPASPANDNAPKITGTATAGTTVRLYTNASCTSAIAASGTAADFGSTGIAVSVADDTSTTFWANVTDVTGDSMCSSTSVSYVEDSTAPAAPTFTGGPSGPSNDDTPSWTFTSSGGTIQCRLLAGATQIRAWGACASPYAPDLTGESDGSFTAEIRATDTAGNVSTASRTYALDRANPAAPTISAEPGTTTNDITPTWEWTGAEAGTVECRIDKGATQIFGWATCASPKTYDLSGGGDGAYTFSVRVTDAAGNLGDVASSGTTLDTLAPGAPAITGSPGADGNDETPTWTFGTVADATIECQISLGATVVDAWAPCATTKTYDLTGQDGTYTFGVRARDVAGNVTAATSTYRLDTAPPAAPTITSGPPAEGSATSPSFGFSGEADATFECRMMKGIATVSGWATCASPQSYALGSETDGTFTFAVRATDAAGNVGGVATRDYVLDRAAPAAPSFTASPPAAGTNASPGWSFSTDASTTVECRLARGSTLVSDWGTCTSPHVPDLSASDGDYTLRLRAKDVAGNLSTETVGSYKLDRVAPDAPVITAAPVPVGAGTNPTWQFAGEALASFECRLITGSTVISDWGSCTSPRSYDLSGEADALYTFAVRAKDAAGNTGTATTGTYDLDRQAPSIDAAPAVSGNSLEPSWSFSATNATSLQCRLDRGTEQVEDWAACTSPKTWNLAGKPDGAYTFSVRALDAGGQASETVTGSYLLDATAPGTPQFGDAPAGVGTGPSPRWTWTGDAGATFECRVERDGIADGPWAACTSPRTLDLAAQPDGRYALSVRAVDAVGNRSTAAIGAYIVDRSAPPAPSFVTSPAPAGSGASASWGFASEPGVAYECQLERDGAVVEAFVACASPRGYDLAPLADGAYVLTVRVTDGAGNTSASRSAPYVLDRQGPDGIKLLGTPGAVGNDRTPTWAFSLAGAAAFECTLRFGTEDLIATGPCSGPQTYELRTGKDGKYVFRVRGLDAVGNAGAELEDPYVLDTEDPKKPEIEGAKERKGADPSPAWRFTAEAGAVLECTLKRGDDVVAKMDECASPKDYALAERGGGKYTFGVRATDAAGNIGELATATYEYEKAAVRTTKEAPRTEPAPAPAGAPAPVPAPAATAPAPAAATKLAAEERSERREKAAKAQARKRAAAAARRRAAAQRAADAARAPAPAPKAPKKRKSAKKKAAEQLAEVGKVMAKAATVAAEKTAFPVLLLGLCGLFLVAQDRVDRRDPKLAMAPMFADPELPFVPPSEIPADEEEQESDS